MPKEKSRISPAALAEVKVAYKEYANALFASEHMPSTKERYDYAVNLFVRWLSHSYDPATWVGRDVTPKKRARVVLAAKDSRSGKGLRV
jgi:hypothetical protein